MSTDRHIDRICIVIISITLVITILFMNGESLGIALMDRTVKYESTLFDRSYVHKIDIVMDDWDTFIENCENEEYSSCTVVIDGEKHTDTAIRAKGNTSLSQVSAMGSNRYSFKLEFDHYESGKTLDGLDKLCLNNLIQDNTMMKDYIAYTLMDSFGADSPLCSYAYLTVNGEDWGLYLAVEGIEDSFLQRNYGSDGGELYKPDRLSFGGGRGNGKDFNMDDLDPDSFDSDSSSSFSFGTDSIPGIGGQGGGFDPGSMFGGGNFDFGGGFDPGNMFGGGSFDFGRGGFDIGSMFGGGMGSDDVKLKYIDDDPESYPNIFDNAKTDITRADKERLISSLKSLSSYSDLEDCLDMDEVLRYFVVHNFLVNADSYTGSMIHNYYLHEKDGRLSMIPWDYNLSYGTFSGNNASSSVNDSIDSPLSTGSGSDRPMYGWILSDEKYTSMYHELFTEFIDEWFAGGELVQLIEDTAEMIRPYVERDPTKFCTSDEFEEGVETLSGFVTLRAEAVTGQLEGNDDPVDTGGLDISKMGTMNGMGRGGSVPSGAGREDSSSGRPGTDSDIQADTRTGDAAGDDDSSDDAQGSEPGGNGGMPDGGSFPGGNSGMPDSGSFPGGNGGMPDSGSFPGGNGGMPDGGSSVPDTPSQGSTTGTQTFNYRGYSSSGDNALKTAVISVAVLLAGIFIALKKKY